MLRNVVEQDVADRRGRPGISGAEEQLKSCRFSADVVEEGPHVCPNLFAQGQSGGRFISVE